MPRTKERAAARQRIETVLALRGITMVFQPVVDIRRGIVVGVEALARFSAEPRRTPDLWFEEGWSVGLGLELELLAIELALEALPSLPPHVYVAVNTDPRTLCSPELARLLLGSGAGNRLVVEITEHAAVDDYDRVNEALAPLRAAGMRLAIDDAGAGFASLQHVLRLRPEIIKLDRSLTAHVEDNPVRGALTAALVTFGASLNAMVCAEGVETEGQLVALQKVGVATAQGYFLARPGGLPLPSIPQGIWPSRADSLPVRRGLGSPAVAVRPRLDASTLLDTVEEVPFQRLTRHAQRVLGAEVALVSLVDDPRSSSLTRSLCQHAVTTRLPLVIDDARSHPLVQGVGAVDRSDVVAYLGVPLVASSDQVLGSLCVIERKPRTWTDAEIATLTEIAAMAVDLLETRHEVRVHRDREEMQRLLFDQVTTASAFCELDGSIRSANRRFTDALGYAPRSLDGTAGAPLHAPEELGPLWEMHRMLLAGDLREATRLTNMVRGDGSFQLMNIRWVIVRNASGGADHTLVTITPP